MIHLQWLISTYLYMITKISDSCSQEKEAENGVEHKKEAVKPVTKSKLIMDQHKRAQALLETQLQQQMLLIQKLESGNDMFPFKPSHY